MKPTEIKLIRVYCNLSQQELADMLNVSQYTVCRWEMRKKKPSNYRIDELCIIAKKYGFKINSKEIVEDYKLLKKKPIFIKTHL